MSRFLESIAVLEGRAQHLEQHQARVRRTLEEYGSTSALDLEHLVAGCKLPSAGYHKLRIEYDLSAFISAAITPYHIRKHTRFTLVELPALDYHLKYADRSALDSAKPANSEIIICQEGCITDASYANILFYTPTGKIITPSTPLLAGIQRELLLREGSVSAALIKTEDLPKFSHFQLINALLSPKNSPMYPISMLTDAG